MEKNLFTHALLFAAFAAPACKESPLANADAQSGASASGDSSDGEVAGVLATVDRGEISQGNLAQSQAADPRVRAYGQSMVSMHTRSTSRLDALRQRVGITPREGDRSRQLAADASSTQRRLEGLRGAEFDRAYIAAQVAQHAQVLETLDNALLPMAHQAELRTALSNEVRPMVAEHLRMAREIQGALGGDNAAPANGTMPGNTGAPNTGMPNNGMPNNGVPNNGVPNNGVPNTAMPNTGMPGTGGAAPR